jgi:desulfoferrodoxin (superoxide reductase-like protein)
MCLKGSFYILFCENRKEERMQLINPLSIRNFEISRRAVLLGGISFLISFLLPRIASAKKSSVEIEAPEKAKKGESIAIKLKVKHKGNNISHYTNWVYLKVNGKEIKRWEYSSTNLPADENFTVEASYKIDGPAEVTAMANCNLHGSSGERSLKIIADI